MVTKKKIIKKKIEDKKQEIKPEIKRIIKPVYKPLFNIPLIIIKKKSKDANYFGIRQWLKNHINLDTFRKIKKSDIEETKLSEDEINKLVREELGE